MLAEIFVALGFLLLVLASFVTSASVGLGGSLLLVPTLVLALGPKEGVAMAALLLGMNNLAKVVAYRRVIPWRKVAGISGATLVGAALGAALLSQVSAEIVALAVIASIGLTLLAELNAKPTDDSSQPVVTQVAPTLLAFGAGATSGFSGTSGPLKGVAIRNLGLDRMYFVGAASVVSLVGDLTKAAVFTQSNILDSRSYGLALLAVPLMLAGTAAGKKLNSTVGERGFAVMFWLVMTGYAVRVGFTAL